MGGSVKREYRSDLRTAQADATRKSIVAAAAGLFEGQGYGSTTIDDVARAAGVSRKTVFTAVGGKAALLATAVEWAIAGDDQPVALAERPELQRIFEAAHPAELIAGWVHVLVQADTRVAALFRALEEAAEVDADAQALFGRLQHQRLDDARRIIDALTDRGALPAGTPVDEAVDIAWLAGDPVLFDRLVRQRDWTVTRFEAWLRALLVERLTGS